MRRPTRRQHIPATSALLSSPLLPTRRCSIKPVDLPELLTATRGVQEALRQAAARRGQGGHGNAYAFRQLTRINIPIDDAGVAQVREGHRLATARRSRVAARFCGC